MIYFGKKQSIFGFFFCCTSLLKNEGKVILLSSLMMKESTRVTFLYKNIATGE